VFIGLKYLGKFLHKIKDKWKNEVTETAQGIDEKRGRTVNRNMFLSLSLSLSLSL
jgi:hypothetical protein